MIVAIHPDDYATPTSGGPDSSSPRWTRLLEDAGHHVRQVDVFRADILSQLRGCDGFMWRHAHIPLHRQVARRLLPVIEKELGIAVYPDQNTCWHYDDKITQYYLLTAANIPAPRTWVWFDYEQAMHWIESATFPLVIKLWSGSASTNVRMVHDHEQAVQWIRKLFTHGVADMNELSGKGTAEFIARLRRAARVILRGAGVGRPWELHRNYLLAQEFINGNDFDTRVVIIGNRAFAKRRFNRPGDFRASGCRNIDCNPARIDMRAVRLAFRTAQRLGAQSLALDILRRGEEFLVVEISYTYPSYAQYECPGHWELKDDEVVWIEGRMWPEEAQIEDFLVRLEEKHDSRSLLCV